MGNYNTKWRQPILSVDATNPKRYQIFMCTIAIKLQCNKENRITMNYSRKLIGLVFGVILCSFFSYGAEELIGESSSPAASSAQSYTGFKSGSQWLMPGLGTGQK